MYLRSSYSTGACPIPSFILVRGFSPVDFCVFKKRHKFMSKPKLIITLIVIILLGINIFWSAKNGKHARPMESITVANTEEYSTLIWIAEQKGYFADNGLTIINKDYQSGKMAADALLAGEADISVSADFVFVINAFTNPDLRILGVIDSVENIELIARKDRGIAQPKDLKQKRVGVTKKSSGEFFLITFLASNGISLSDTELVDVNPKDMEHVIAKGDIDAVLTWPPNVFNIKKILGENALSWPSQSGQKYNMLLLAKERFVEEKPKAVKKFLRSLLQAEEFINHNADEARERIAKKYGYTKDYMDAQWPQHDFIVSLPQDLVSTMEWQARWAVKSNLWDGKPPLPYVNFLDLIYFDALAALRPERVTIIR